MGLFVCAETPEGGSVGVVKNISYMAHITIQSNSQPLHDYVEPYLIKLDNLQSKELNGMVKVFINGCWLGVVKKAYELYERYKDKKYKGVINIYTSIIFDYQNKEIKLCNDAGRLN